MEIQIIKPSLNMHMSTVIHNMYIFYEKKTEGYKKFNKVKIKIIIQIQF